YWKAKLTGAPEALDVPCDFPRPARHAGNGSTVWLRLPEDAVRRLHELGARERTTLYMILLAAWAMLLGRLSGRRDVVVGTPVRGRTLPDVQKVMGFFVNAVPIRVAFDPDRSFVELLAGVRAEVIGALGHADVPFEHLVRVLDVRRDASR